MTYHAAAFLLSHPQHGSISKLRGLPVWLICLVFLNSALPVTGWAQSNPPAPLPPAAQQALDKGIIAAKVSDYPLAIRFFEDARKLAPLVPVIFMNLGIAESKMPGRELRAIAWFGAYLAASPDAPNAAAVKQQIAVLDVKNQSNVSRLIKTVQDAANQKSAHKSENLCLVARLWVKAGNIPEAVKIVDRMQHPVPDSAVLCIARAKREIAKAQEPPEAPSPDRKSTVGVKATKGEIEWLFEQGGFAWLTKLDGNSYNHSGWIIGTVNRRGVSTPIGTLSH